jgi:hypothetical protein
MPIFKSLPIIKIINGKEIKTSEAVVVIDTTYKTNGESVVVVKEVDECNLFLDSNTTDHVVVKALTNVVVSANETIDEEYNEIELGKGACVEFRKIGDYWYILSSDGLKGS